MVCDLREALSVSSGYVWVGGEGGRWGMYLDGLGPSNPMRVGCRLNLFFPFLSRIAAPTPPKMSAAAMTTEATTALAIVPPEAAPVTLEWAVITELAGDDDDDDDVWRDKDGAKLV